MGKRILITDDSIFMRVTLKNILTQNGYEVVGEASNGNEALASYNTLKPDLVTMDITMPEMDGIEAVRQIKLADPAAKVVMCSAMGQKEKVIESLQAGAKDFIVKPFRPDRVIQAIEKLIR